ncbi:MAG TPA: enoyl-CoA hydratase-related protein [Mycobacteriales bacterium]|nr:enoyl-CoA hydratase-related protein [Mycobacteriales bacterium]
MADEELTLVEVRPDGVAVVTLNRPERRNAWSPELEVAYFGALERVDTDPRVRAVVVTGAGTTFCPGMDVARLESLAGTQLTQDGRLPVYSPWRVRKPMIAAVNGACAGIGLVQALLCDVRFIASTAKISTSFARRGLAGEYGLTWLLPRMVGLPIATELLLSARTVTADEAMALGLVTRVVDPEALLDTAVTYAADIAEHCAPTSLAMLRHQLHLDGDATFVDAMRRSYHAMAAAVAGADLAEGVASLLEKRPPSFAPLPDDYDPAAILGADVVIAHQRPETLLPD